MFNMTIGKPDTPGDVLVGPLTAANLAWMELVDALEEGQDDTIGEEGTNQEAYDAYQEAIETALDADWAEPGSVTVAVDDGLVFQVVQA